MPPQLLKGTLGRTRSHRRAREALVGRGAHQRLDHVLDEAQALGAAAHLRAEPKQHFVTGGQVQCLLCPHEVFIQVLVGQRVAQDSVEGEVEDLVLLELGQVVAQEDGPVVDRGILAEGGPVLGVELLKVLGNAALVRLRTLEGFDLHGGAQLEQVLLEDELVCCCHFEAWPGLGENEQSGMIRIDFENLRLSLAPEEF